MNMAQTEGDLNSELQEVLANENADSDARDSKGGTWSLNGVAPLPSSRMNLEHIENNSSLVRLLRI